MNFFRLLLRNLRYHWRGNFAVFLGVALGTAVLTGALLVGDSLRGSLQELALDQLGWVHGAMTANRFFRADLEFDRLLDPHCHVVPVLMLKGSAGKIDAGTGEPLPGPTSKITLLGVNADFWFHEKVPLSEEFWQFSDHPKLLADQSNEQAVGEVVLNRTLAETLEAKVGDTLALRVQKADSVPRETLLGKRGREQVIDAIRVRVKDILPERGLARFTLQPSPEPVRNAFVPLKFLQARLKLQSPPPGRVNVLLSSGINRLDPSDDPLSYKPLPTLEDWNLKLRSPADRAAALIRFLDPSRKFRDLFSKDCYLSQARWLGRVPEALAKKVTVVNDESVILGKDILEYYRQQRNYFLLESEQLLLDDTVVEAVEKIATDHGRAIELGGERWQLCPTLIYLADTIASGNKQVPYAIVAAQGPSLTLPARMGDKERPLAKDEIDLAEWPDSPLAAVKSGDTITLEYYKPDEHNQLQKAKETFKLRKTFKLEGRYDDPDLVPEFPGITDKLDLSKWNERTLPFPYDRGRIKPADEKFWKRYRTTPRAYIALETAQKLWGSRFGSLTSYRIFPPDQPKYFEPAMGEFRAKLLKALDPAKGGFVWQDVRAQGLKAGGGSTDFGELFLSFSFFLIVSALLLVGLLFRLNLDLRAREMGILLATGWTHGRVRRLLLAEGGLLAILGGFVGLVGALGYAHLLLHYLSATWPGEQKLQFLTLHATPLSLFYGWMGSMAISFLTILWAAWALSRMTPTRLLAGETTATMESGAARRSWSQWVALACVLGAVALLALGMLIHDQQALGFFGSGGLLLIASLIEVSRRFKSAGRHSNPRQSLIGLAVRNAGRHTVRSVLTVGLLSSATFLIVAMEAFHQETDADFLAQSGGSGGFPLLAQTDVPVFQDLNDANVRKQLGFPADVEPIQAGHRIFSCRLQAGDDASCLNLYQPQKPRILGVPQALIERGGFSFGSTLAKTDEEIKNPWLQLEKTAEDTIPIFVAENSAEYILNKSLGDIIEVQGDGGKNFKLQIVGLFHEGIFQSELVLSEANFRRVFPRQEGFSFFLIDAPAGDMAKVKAAWQTALGDNGVTVQTTRSRVEKYLAVENMYLATFQALGGLGLLLGAAGLAIVLLRSVWERRGELALLRALGFRRLSLAWLVLAENAFLLLLGLFVGTVSAILAVAPQIFGGEAHVLGVRVLMLLGLVIAVGLAAGLAAVLATLRAPLLQTLRDE